MNGVVRVVALLTMVLTVSGCSTVGYYSQIVSGHMKIVMGKRALEDVLADPETDDKTRHRLQVASNARRYAIDRLGLPDNNSYTTFYDTGRNYVTWNVIAAGEFTLSPRTWCFPIAGCVSYRGYYAREDAVAYADKLKTQGLDVAVTGATAYSTLGWFADPLLNTILNRSDASITGLIFHELAHQQLYVADDSTFNESFATFVEREGLRQWQKDGLASQNSDAVQQLADRQARRRDFISLLNETKVGLRALYNSDLPETQMRAEKQRHFEQMKVAYGQLKERWGGYRGYDGWFSRPLNNARLAAVGTYNDYLPAFASLFAEGGEDFQVFYKASKNLADLSLAARKKRIAELAASAESNRQSVKLQ